MVPAVAVKAKELEFRVDLDRSGCVASEGGMAIEPYQPGLAGRVLPATQFPLGKLQLSTTCSAS
jgi:hypothetical protein